MKKIEIKTDHIRLYEKLYIDHDMQNFIINKIQKENYDKLLFLVDRHLFDKQKNYIKTLAKKSGARGIIFLNPEPRSKNFEHCGHLIKKLIAYKLNRKSCLVAIGGGFVADMAGFISSIFMRGIDFIQIPTTMMGMSDAVVGKVAVNFKGFKNLLGSFYFPKFVFVDTYFLKTLPEKEIVFGLIEVWKHTLLVQNQKILKMIKKYLSVKTKLDEMQIIKFSLETKKRFVKVDYNDRTGAHKALSLGHTFANYLELTYNLRHGPAVFYGIIFITLLSYNLKMINTKKFKSIMQIIKLFENKIGLINDIQKKLQISDVVKKLKFDKINLGVLYTFVVLANDGFCIKKDISTAVLTKTFGQFKNIKL